MENKRNEILRGEELRKDFFIRRKQFPVLKNINLSLNEGEVVLITGKSGAGKSTLISLLSGLEPPSDGALFWENIKLNNSHSESWAVLRREKIGVIFQDYNLITSWTAFQNIEASLLFRNLPESQRSDEVRGIMEKLGILPLAGNKPAEMSEGQQQRTAVARTIVSRPRLILADEPTGGVDPETGEAILSSLLTLVKNNNSGMLITTHGGIDAFEKIADRIYKMDDGTLLSLQD